MNKVNNNILRILFILITFLIFKMNNTLCLVMIVKDEIKILKRCFDSVKNYIDYWVICDTGSTDGTQSFIKSYFEKHNIKGELHNHKWKNFGYNRTLAVNRANGKSDYMLLMDSDFILNVKDKNFKRNMKIHGNYIKYEGEIDYKQLLLIKSGIHWRYVGETHEYVESDERINTNFFHGFTIEHKQDSSTRSNKTNRDICFLLKCLKSDPSNCRNLFYLGESYKANGEYDKALEYYRKYFDTSIHPEEKYYTKYQIGWCKMKKGDDFDDFKNDLLNAHKLRPTRLEALYTLIEYCRINDKSKEGFNYGIKEVYTEYPDKDLLFILKPIYNWVFKNEIAICAYNINKPEISIKIYGELFENKIIPKERIKEFVAFYRLFLNKLQKKMKNKETLESLDSYVSKPIKNNSEIKEVKEKVVKIIKKELWVSLTTIPSRLSRIHLTLESIKNQTLKPDRINLCIPEICKKENCEYNLPNTILNDPLINIVKCKKDYGPATKLLGSLEICGNPETIIITVDDDIIYDTKLVERLYEYSKTNPNSAIGFCGWNIEDLLESKEVFYNKLMYEEKCNFKNGTTVDILEGWRGVLYKTSFFDMNIFNYSNAPKSSYFVDDVWISGNLKIRGIERKIIKFKENKKLERYDNIWKSNFNGSKKFNNSLSTMVNFYENNVGTAKYIQSLCESNQ